MGASDDARRRRIHQDDATRVITGFDPRASSSADAIAAQRFQIADFIRAKIDGGFSPMVVIEQMLAGAAFIGDNYGVSRQQMAEFITLIALGEERSLIWVPR